LPVVLYGRATWSLTMRNTGWGFSFFFGICTVHLTRSLNRQTNTSTLSIFIY
jgi:hypothetical protein